MKKQTTVKNKKWYQSKTLWFNILVIAGGIGTWAAGQVEAGIAITLPGLFNTALRIATKNGIKFD